MIVIHHPYAADKYREKHGDVPCMVYRRDEAGRLIEVGRMQVRPREWKQFKENMGEFAEFYPAFS